MSLSVLTYAPGEQVLGTPLMLAVLRRKLSGSRNLWALADQVLISGTNFVTMILVARGLSKTAFGEFSLVYTGLLFANLLQTGLVTQPHNVLGASRSERDLRAYRRYSRGTAIGQFGLAVLEALAAACLASFAHARHWHTAPLLLSLVPAIVAWQIQEFVRRVFYSEGRTGAALVNDIISYGGQTLAIAALWWNNRLTETSAMYALAITSAAAAMVGLWQLRRHLFGRFDGSALLENWDFGKWLLGSEVLTWCYSISAYMYLAGGMLGAAASGELRAVQILFGPARVIAFFLCTVLPIQFAQALTAGGHSALRRQLTSISRFVIPVMAGYCLLVATLARPLLTLAYGREYAGSATTLALYSAVAFLTYAQMLVTAALTAMRRTRMVFIGSVCGALLTLALAWLLVKQFALPGALAGMILTNAVVTILLWQSYRKSVRAGSVESIDGAPPGRDGEQLDGARSALHPPLAASHVSARQGREAASSSSDSPHDTPGELLKRVLHVLDRAAVPWCILHGYASLPDQVESDVDMLVPANLLPRRIVELLRANEQEIGARLINWLNEGAQWIVLAAGRESGPPTVLQLHLTGDYTTDGRIFATGEEILRTRRRHQGLWIPAADVEFACVLANRICKQDLADTHAAHLSELYPQDAAGGNGRLSRLLRPEAAKRIVHAVEGGEWQPVRSQIATLRRQLRASPGARCAGCRVAQFFRRVHRWLWPACGLHVVFLGPDGVGKSSVIDGFMRDLAPAFLRTSYLTFAPSLLPAKLAPAKPAGPHSLPPRSFPASLVKASWWLVCYTLGYLTSVYPTLARAGLVVNHRYLLDAIVDCRRYRYSGPRWLLKWIWAIAPKPDLVFLLDAPADVIRQRKSELPPEHIATLREGYLAVVRPLPNGHVIDATQPLAKVIADVEGVVLRYMSRRCGYRLNSGTRPDATDASPGSGVAWARDSVPVVSHMSKGIDLEHPVGGPDGNIAALDGSPAAEAPQ